MSTNNKSPLGEELRVVNIGLEMFADALREQSVKVVQVDWRPPADGDTELLGLLDQLL